MNQIYKTLQAVWSQLMPPRCCLCDAPGHQLIDLCSGCLADLPRLNRACRSCADQLVVGDVCGRCQRRPPSYDSVNVGFCYAQPIDHLISQLKFGRKQAYGRLLARLMAPQLPTTQRPQWLLPVPLHRSRHAQRGFNQAVVLAQELARISGIPVDRNALRKNRPTRPQMELDAAARRNNLRNAFSLNPRFEPSQHVALVDDVMTTGTTAEELARLLKAAGVKRVDVWVCARA